jgi:outer membrane protein insertion porin family
MQKNLVWAAVALVLSPFACAQQVDPREARFTVGDIRVEGLQRVSEGTVYNYLPVNIGDELTAQRLREAMRALFATGFFRNVELRRDDSTLVIVVKERPSIESFEIKGNKDFKTEELTKSLRNLGLAAGKTFDRAVLEELRGYLTEQYFSRGKYGVIIDTKVEDQPDNRVRIKVDVKEGARARIRQINIVGNTKFKDKDIRETFELQTPKWNNWWKASTRYSRESLSGDLEKLKSYYQDRGYANMDIESAQVTIAPEKDDMFITVSVKEGEVYKISSADIAGNTIVPLADLRALLLVQKDQIYSQQLISATQKLLENRLGIEG